MPTEIPRLDAVFSDEASRIGCRSVENGIRLFEVRQKD
jgi:hypothetical protein